MKLDVMTDMGLQLKMALLRVFTLAEGERNLLHNDIMSRITYPYILQARGENEARSSVFGASPAIAVTSSRLRSCSQLQEVCF